MNAIWEKGNLLQAEIRQGSTPIDLVKKNCTVMSAIWGHKGNLLQPEIHQGSTSIGLVLRDLHNNECDLGKKKEIYSRRRYIKGLHELFLA